MRTGLHHPSRLAITQDVRGATLVEAIIAFGLLATLAISLIPLFKQSDETHVRGELKALCEQLVHAKLENYRNGMPVKVGVAPYTNAAMGWRIDALTLPRSVDTTLTSSTGFLSGFYYAKLRYNMFSRRHSRFDVTSGTPYQFSGTEPPDAPSLNFSVCGMWAGREEVRRGFPNTTIGALGSGGVVVVDYNAPAGGSVADGMRECIGSESAWTAGLQNIGVAPPVCNTPADTTVQGRIPGFELYVKLQLDTPFPLGIQNPPPVVLPGHDNYPPGGATSAALHNRYGDLCPYQVGAGGGGAALDEPAYDFNGYGDGIRVTVSGRYDTNAVRRMLNLPAVSATAPRGSLGLQCRASAVMRPRQEPLRYIFTASGEFLYASYRARNNAVGATSLTQKIFQNIDSTGILGFSVHPRNLSMYVLRNGVLTRYGSCVRANAGGGQFRTFPENCATTPTAITNLLGVADNGALNNTTVQDWTIDAPLAGIGIDYQRGLFYGLASDRRTLLRMRSSVNNGAAAEFPQHIATGDCAAGISTCKVVLDPWPMTAPIWGMAFPGGVNWPNYAFPDTTRNWALNPFGEMGYVIIPAVNAEKGTSVFWAGGTATVNLYDPLMLLEDQITAASP